MTNIEAIAAMKRKLKDALVHFDRWSLILLAFLLPLEKKLVPLLIALIMLRWLLSGQFLKIPSGLRNSRTKTFLALFGLFYVLHFIGLVNTANMESGWFDLEVKLSLLIFPLLFISMDPAIWDGRSRRILLAAFVAGSLLSISICLIRAAWIWNTTDDSAAFYYSRLSWFHHPAYMAMYLNFATVICLYFLIENRDFLSRFWKAVFVFLILIFMTSVVLLSSKAGVLGMILILFFSMIYLIIRQKMIVQGILWFLLSVSTLYVLLLIFPLSGQRLEKAVETFGSSSEVSTQTTESTGERLLIWKASIALAGENFFTGVGIGDVMDELIKVYEKRGITAAVRGELNTHNQFLQTQIGLGIIGALALILMFVLPLVAGVRRDYFLYVLFLMLFGFNMLFESMLQTQSGVIFYAFFNVFLYSSEENSSSHELRPVL